MVMEAVLHEEITVIEEGAEPFVPRRILIVDDSRLQRKLLASSLKRWGYDVVEADSGKLALEICNEQPPEMIISDWMMPEMNGLEFCRELRAKSQGTYIYFVLLTSKSETAEIAAGLESGADDFLTKPVDGNELRARLQAGWRILEMQTELRERNDQLHEALTEVQRLNAELDKDLSEARNLQQSLVPQRFKPFDNFDASFLLKSSGYVGGDLVGYYPAGQNKIGLFSIDVSGHGISAALMSARLAGCLSAAPDQNLALSLKPDGSCEPIEPADAISALNDLVLSEMDTEHYFTILLADFDCQTGLMRLGQAGHPHPLVQRASGAIEQTGPGGFPVGLIEDAEFSQFEIQLEPGDRILFHSDGITECPSQGGQFLEPEGLERMMDELRDQSGFDLLEALCWKLSEFSGEEAFPDDVSAILLEYNGVG